MTNLQELSQFLILKIGEISSLSPINSGRIVQDTPSSDSLDRLDNGLVCATFPRQKPKSDCSSNRNRRFHVCAGRVMPRKAAAVRKKCCFHRGKRATKAREACQLESTET